MLVPHPETTPQSIEAALARYQPCYRTDVAACAAISPRIAQLALTHPFLLLAIATAYGSRQCRRRAVELVAGGAPLHEACTATGIPMCFRRIPPEGCVCPPVAVMWSAEANRALAPLIPKQPTVAARWLAGICFAHAASDETFAIWLARARRLFEDQPPTHAHLLPLALYAWCSRFLPYDVEWCISPSWTPILGLPAAIMRAASFIGHIDFVSQFGRAAVRDAWIAEQEVTGYRFVPLLTPSDLVREAKAMSNCVMSYSYAIASDECRLFSMQRGGERVATIEIRPTPDGRWFAIRQIKGPMNADCPIEYVEVAHGWLEATRFQRGTRTDISVRDDPSLGRLAEMIELWRTSRAVPLPGVSTDIEALQAGMADLSASLLRRPRRVAIRRPA